MRWQIRAPSRTLVLQSVCIIFCILFGVQICSCNVALSIYHKAGNTRLTDSYSNLWKVTAITCCSICNTDNACKSVTYSPGSQECRLSSGTFTNVGSNSENSDEWATYYKPHDCNDIGKTGNPLSGAFDIFPAGAQYPIKIFCDFDDSDGPWSVIQRRVDGTVDFYRNYTEYQTGFGSLSGNFWLGLDKISSISLQDNKRYCLKVTLVDTVNGIRFAHYSRFQVMNVTTGYMLHVGGYSGNAGDSLEFHNGQLFSTYDRDMDPDIWNCAEANGGAWWYNTCHHSNLNGKYGNNTYGYGINWSTTTSFDRSATFASMKIKDCI